MGEMRNTLDDAMEALANSNRRRLLRELRNDDPPGVIPVTSLETGPGERSAIEMTHVHLPKLAEEDIVEWDRESGTVGRGPAFEWVMPVLDVLDDHAATTADCGR